MAEANDCVQPPTIYRVLAFYAGPPCHLSDRRKSYSNSGNRPITSEAHYGRADFKLARQTKQGLQWPEGRSGVGNLESDAHVPPQWHLLGAFRRRDNGWRCLPLPKIRDVHRAEDVLRALAVGSGGGVYVASNPMTGAQIKKHLAPSFHSSHAGRLGRAAREAAAAKKETSYEAVEFASGARFC